MKARHSLFQIKVNVYIQPTQVTISVFAHRQIHLTLIDTHSKNIFSLETLSQLGVVSFCNRRINALAGPHLLNLPP